MRRTLGLTLVVGGLCATMLAGPTPAASAGPLGQPDRAGLADPPGQIAKAPLVGELAKAPGLTMSVGQLAPARAGGEGVVSISLTSTSRGSAPIKGLTVRLKTPDATSMGALSGKGWVCWRQGVQSATCRHRDPLGRTEDPAPILAHIRVATSVTRAAVRLSAWATWRDDLASADTFSVTSQGSLTVHRSLTLDLTSPQGPTALVFRGGDPSGRELPLQASIGNIHGQKTSAEWFQVSGPRATFVSDTTVDQASAQLEQLVRVPAKSTPQTYVFGVRVTSLGQTRQRQLRITVQTADPLGKVRPGSVNLQRVADGAVLPELTDGAAVSDSLPVHLSAPTTARPGSTISVAATTAQSTIAAVSWAVDGAPVSGGTTLRVKAPTTPGTPLMVSAVVHLANGHSHAATTVIVAAERTAASTPRASPSAAARTTFCEVATSVRDSLLDAGLGKAWLELGDTQRFSFKLRDARPSENVFDTSGNCTGEGSLQITNGILAHSKFVRLTEIAATLTANGLQINEGQWVLNTGGPVTDSVGLDLTGSLTAPSEGAAYSSVSGSMSFQPNDDSTNPLAWIPLPDGWDFLPNASRVDFFTGADATDDDTGIADGTVRLSQIATSPPTSSGQRGELALSLDINDDTATLLRVAAANISLGETPNAGALLASGVAYTPLDRPSELANLAAGALTLRITCMKEDVLSDSCEVVDGFTLSNMRLALNRQGVDISAKAAVAYGSDKAYGFDLTGSYHGVLDWSLKAGSTNVWDLGRGMTLRDLRGSLGISSAKKSTGEFLVDFTGTFGGLKLGDGVTLSKLTPALTNLCPAEDDACTAEDLRLSITATITAALPGQSTPVDFAGSAVINLRTLKFTFRSGFSDVKFGPEALNLNGLQLVLTNDTLSGCLPANTDDTETADGDANGLALRLTAHATLLEKQFELNAQVNKSGLCVWGNGPTMDLGEGFRAVTPRLTYTSYADGANITFADGVVAKWVKPQEISLTGGFEFSPAVKQRFEIPGKGVLFTAIVSTDFTKAKFAVTYRADGEIAFYRGPGAELLMQDVGFSISYDALSAEIAVSAFGTADLVIEGGDGAPSSTTTMGVLAAFEFSATGVRLAVQAGVVADQPVPNAFGQPGLTVEQLALSATVDLVTGAPSIAVNARATLPPGWSESIGISAGTPLTLAFSAGAAAPCLEFGIGAKGSTTTAVDLAGLGLMKTNYFRLVLAPMGCELPVGIETKKVSPGWAFAFEGQLLGGPVAMEAAITVSTTGLILKANAAFDRWDLYGVTFRSFDGKSGPSFTFDIDTAKQKYDVKFNGAIEIGRVSTGAGALVAVKGGIDLSNDDSIGVDIEGAGAATLIGQRIDIRPVTIKGNIPRVGKESATNRLMLTAKIGVSLEVLGQQINAYGDMDFRAGRVVSLAVATHGSFDAIVGAVQGTVAVDLCLGTLASTDDTAANPTGRTCELFPQDSWDRATYSLRIGFYGWRKWVFGDKKPYSEVLLDQIGAIAAA